MFQFHTVTDDERKRCAAPYAVLPQADARAYGMITARKPNGGRKYPRTHASEFTSDCVVTTATGDVYTIKRGRNHKPRVTHKQLVEVQRHRINAADLAPIGNIE